MTLKFGLAVAAIVLLAVAGYLSPTARDRFVLLAVTLLAIALFLVR